MNLQGLYEERKQEIKARLKDFELMGYRPPKDIFPELCFCLLTPGSKAFNADTAIKELQESGLLLTGSKEKIASVLKGKVRFHNNKARSIVEARSLFQGDRFKEVLRLGSNKDIREFLVENVRGLGWKEASHFLRNVGHGDGIGIIDRHILKNLKEFGFIPEVPKSMTTKKYMEMERKVVEFSQKVGIPMEELDLLLWSKEAGKVFK